MAIFTLTATGRFGAPIERPTGALSSLPADSDVVVIWSGQSNWVGTPYANAYSGRTPTRAKWWRDTAGNGANGPNTVDTNPAPSRWEPVSSGVNNYRSQHSPTIHFINAFEAAYPNLNLYVVEAGKDGGGFANDAYNPGDQGYTRLQTNMTNALANLEATNPDFKLWAFVWNQWEADAARGETAAVTNYPVKLPAFFTAVRDFANASSLPIVSIKPNAQNTVYPASHVESTRQTLITHSTAMVNIDDIPLLPDGLHYSPASYEIIGAREFEALNQIDPQDYVAPPSFTPTETNLGGLSVLPNGWVNKGAAIAFQSDGIAVSKAKTPRDYELVGVEGTVVNLEHPVELYFKTPPANEFAIGINTNVVGWLNQSVRRGIMATRRGLYVNANEYLGTFTQDLGQNSRCKMTLTPEGTGTRVQMFRLVNSVYEGRGSFLAPTRADFAGAKFALDPQAGVSTILEKVVN